ncbi:hypothetical protein JTB14_015998 [Gonioctena quinquepunctata]|nr:hypothetical protein JTB14_015998 [Gonioctena quinquepunctata]
MQEAFMNVKAAQVSSTPKGKTKYPPTSELIDCKNTLDILLVMTRTAEGYNEVYREVKKRYNRLLVDVRKEHYKKRIDESDNKTKCVWQIVSEIKGNPNRKKELKIPGDPNTGCTLSKHSDVKPPEPEKPVNEIPEDVVEVKPFERTSLERPPLTTNMIRNFKDQRIGIKIKVRSDRKSKIENKSQENSSRSKINRSEIKDRRSALKDQKIKIRDHQRIVKDRVRDKDQRDRDQRSRDK